MFTIFKLYITYSFIPSKGQKICQRLWFVLVIPALGRKQREEDQKSNTNLSCPPKKVRKFYFQNYSNNTSKLLALSDHLAIMKVLVSYLFRPLKF
jgi:hypothetical protein